MRIGLYVVTEAIEACGKSMETVSPEEEQGGVFEDGALALQAMLREEPGGTMRDRFLYAASFEDGALRLDKLILGMGYEAKENRYKLLFEQK